MTKWPLPSPPPLQAALPPRQLLHPVPLRRQVPCLQASPTATLLSRVSFLPVASPSSPDTLSNPATASLSNLDTHSSPAMASLSSLDIRSNLNSPAMASLSSPTPSLRQQPLLQSQRKKA